MYGRQGGEWRPVGQRRTHGGDNGENRGGCSNTGRNRDVRLILTVYCSVVLQNVTMKSLLF